MATSSNNGANYRLLKKETK